MKRLIPTIAMFSLMAAISGCVSPEEKARQSAQIEAARARQERNRQEAAVRAERVKQNWSKLHEGLSSDEVDQLIGPLDEKCKQFLKDFGDFDETIGVTCENDIYILRFGSGKLKSWTLR